MAGLDQELDTDPRQREWQAAVALARRRRLGPFRQKERKEHRDRDLAAMARGGFEYDACQKGDRRGRPRCTGRDALTRAMVRA